MSIVNNGLLNWKIFIVAFGFIALISTINTKITILPISGLNFILCSLLVWFLSLWITLIGLHKLLQQSKPIEFVLHKKFKNILTKPKKELQPKPERIKALSNDIEKYFIDKWYCNISNNVDFKDESKIVLEDVIKKLVEVQLHLNNKVLLHGCLNIYLKHLKEFRRTLKRKEKYGADIEDLYRYSHTCSGSTKSKEYYIHQLTIHLLSHFLNWELWNSLPCHVLVSIIARKLTMYILHLVSSPDLINYFLLQLIISDKEREKLNLDKYTRINITQYYDVVDKSSKTEQIQQKFDPVSLDEVDTTEKVIETTEPKKIEEAEKLQDAIDITENNVEKTENNCESTVIEESRAVSKPVKIYEPKSATTKTWNDSQDLVSVSLGQDPLDCLQDLPVKPLGKSSFWENCSTKSDEIFDDSPTSAANQLLNEMKNITSIEGFKSSIKPFSDATVHTLHNIKDLQESTVNNALTKIGDFQDEAAGVVEGLLDFGRAGLRKGLRLTGLQDNVENAKPTSQQGAIKPVKKKPAKLTRSDSQEKMSSGESVESVWVNPLQFDSPSFDGQILLEKTKKSEITIKGETEQPQIPFISMDTIGDNNESPDPEYEEAADLASTIAKLRSLLQQKSSESTMSTPAISPLPPDDFAQKLMIAQDTIAEMEEVDGMMPSFIKFCAKTTDVFHKSLNTIKTALPGNLPGSQFISADRWIFVQSESESDLLSRIKKLVTERKDFCTVDTAYEAIDSLDSMQRSVDNFVVSNLQFEDELDDFEVKLPITKALMDVLCEMLADTDTPFIQEPMIKSILLLFGTVIENSTVMKSNSLMETFGTGLFTIPATTRIETLDMSFDAFIDTILISLPDYIKHVFGNETLEKALTLFVSSLQIQRINQDLLLQIFELTAMKLIDESNQLSPPASA